jgi:uncharacterized protein (DUF362 family)
MSRVFVAKVGGDLHKRLEEALEWLDWKSIIQRDSRVFIKPNLTNPFYKEGVTTSPVFLEALVRVLRTHCRNVAIGEGDGGYHAWKAGEALRRHGLYELQDKYGVEVVSLNDSPREYLSVSAKGRTYEIPLPRRLTHETDVFISAPVLKVHCMTRFTFGLKNQWGCILDPYRLRFHHIFAEAILAINQRLRPQILISDPFWGLTDRGPMEGTPFALDTLIAATDVHAFDRVGCEVLGLDAQEVPYLALADRLGRVPALASLEMNRPIDEFRTHKYHLEFTPRDKWVHKAFCSSWLTYLLYYSIFGRLLHRVYYAVTGKGRLSSEV